MGVCACVHVIVCACNNCVCVGVRARVCACMRCVLVCVCEMFACLCM